MKRVVSSSIITLFIFLIAVIAFLYVRNMKKSGGDPFKAIPADVSFIIACNMQNDVSAAILLPEVWSHLNSIPAFENLGNQLEVLNKKIRGKSNLKGFFIGTPVYLSAHVTGAGTFDFLFLKSLDNGFTESGIDNLMEELAGDSVEPAHRNYDGNMIREISLSDSKVFTYVIAKELFIGSFTPFLVEDALRQLKLGKPVLTENKVIESLRSVDSIAVAVNYSNLTGFAGIFINPDAVPGFPGIKAYGKWAVTDVSIFKNRIGFSGFIFSNDSTALINCFEGQKPVEKNLLKILPRKTAAISYFGYTDKQRFYSNLSNRYLATQQPGNRKILKSIKSNYKLNIEEKILSWLGNEYALVITDPPGLNYDNSCFAILKANDMSLARKSLKEIRVNIDKKTGNKTMEEDYNGHSIGFIRLTGVLPAMFGDIFSRIKKMYYTDIGGYIIFANQPAAIRTFIDEYTSGLLLYHSENFKNDLTGLNTKANHFFYIRPQLSLQIFRSIATATWNSFLDHHRDVLSAFAGFAFQVSEKESQVTVDIIQNFSMKPGEAGVDRIFTISTDSSVTGKPLLTTDPVSGMRQIVFNDDAGNLYMTDNSGNILWKQPIDGKILSDLYEIDLFRNNTRQFLFNTAEYIYLLDNKGNPVGNYPIRLPAPATNGLAAFDFDKNRDFKIYVACKNKRIYAYLPSGKPLPGWNFQGTTEIVTSTLKKFSFSNREMLLVTEQNGKLTIVNRYGEQNMVLQNDLHIGMNSGIFKSEDGSMLFTDDNGNIIKLKSDGSADIITIPGLSPDHGFVYSDADDDGEMDFIFMEGHEITAYNKDLTLIYRKSFDQELSGSIQLEILKHDRPALMVRSETAGKTWLLKPDGTVYPGFPVTGGAPGIVDELNLDGNKNLLVGGNEKQLNAYSIE